MENATSSGQRLGLSREDMRIQGVTLTVFQCLHVSQLEIWKKGQTQSCNRCVSTSRSAVPGKICSFQPQW